MSFKKFQIINPDTIGNPENNYVYLGRDEIGLWEKYSDGEWIYIITGSTTGAGTSGTSGFSGSSGADGSFYGSSGSSGEKGSSGKDGINGSSGRTGTHGTSGFSGSNGVSGTSGISGLSGSSGYSGSSGKDGSSGITGTSGTSSNGSSGTSGLTGSSGTSGENGAYGGASRLWSFINSIDPMEGQFYTNGVTNLSLINNLIINVEDYDSQDLTNWLSSWNGGLLKIEKWGNASIFGIYQGCISTQIGSGTRFQISSILELNSNGSLINGELYLLSFVKTNTIGTGSSGLSGSSGISGSSGTSSNGSSGSSGVDGTPGINGDMYATTSNTELDIPTSHPTNLFLTGGTNLSYITAQEIIISHDINNYFTATIDTYNPLNGDFVVISSANVGVGTGLYPWEINLSGAPGKSGSSGISGSSGTSGTSGLSGTSGTSGTSGISGTSGLSGTSGTSGFSGTSGTGGTSGTSGTSGKSGSSGTSGLSGTSGTSGLSGTSGTSGLSGTSGTSGLSGTSGTSGLSGTSGKSGSSGNSGTSGSSGFSGTSGSSGITGTSGTSGKSGSSGVGFSVVETLYYDDSINVLYSSGITTSGLTLFSIGYNINGSVLKNDGNGIAYWGIGNGSSGISGNNGSSGISSNGSSGSSGVDGTSADSFTDIDLYYDVDTNTLFTPNIYLTGSTVTITNIQNINDNDTKLILDNDVLYQVTGVTSSFTDWVKYRYVSHVSQTGTTSPYAIELLNTTGTIVSYTYNSVGNYTLTCSGKLTSGKTDPFSETITLSDGNTITMTWQNINTYLIETKDSVGVNTDEILSSQHISFDVYW